MSDALRQIFAEFGFDTDEESLTKLEAKLRGVIDATKRTTKATDDTSKSLKKSGDSARNAAKPVSSYLDLLKRVDDAASEGIGAKVAPQIRALSNAFPSLNKHMERYGVDLNDAASAGRVLVGGTLAMYQAFSRAVGAAFQFADAFAADAEALRDTARESRVTTTQLQELEHAAVQGGVGVERMRSGLATFGQSLRSAERWGNGTTSTLRRLGIQARDTSGHIRPTGELMDEVAAAMERVENPTRRARIATELFGASGRRMLDVLHTGPGGIAALRAELAELGGGITPEATAAANEYTKATERMARAQDSLRSVLAVSLIPALSWLVEKGAKLGGLVANLTHGTHLLQIALAGLAAAAVSMAAPVIAAWLPVALPFAVIAAKVAFLVALLDDLITFANGGDSAIGRLIDTIAGAGTAVELAKELREDWEAITEAIDKAVDAVARFVGSTAAGGLASGNLRGPMIGGRRAAAGGAPLTVPAGNGAFRLSLPVPATRAVAAPGAIVSHTRVTQVNRTHAPVIQVNGVTDPNAVATRVGQILAQQERDRRDGDHPVEDDDDDAPARGVEG